MDKTIAFLLAGVMVGAGVGIGVGYVVFNENGGGGDDTYWFYIDFSEIVGESPDNRWISAKAGDAVTAFIAALKGAGLWDEGGVSGTGWITSLAGFENGVWENDTGGTSWMSWVWTADNTVATAEAWRDNPGFNNSIGTMFYIGYTHAIYDEDSYGNFVLMKEMNPNSAISYDANWNPVIEPNSWAVTGPFAPA